MAGLTGFDVEIDSNPSFNVLDAQANAVRRTLEPAELAAGTARLAVERGNALTSDYSATALQESHTVSFPNGTGARPKSMKDEDYAELLARHWPPVFARDVQLMCHVYSMIQRKNINLHTWLRVSNSTIHCCRSPLLCVASCRRCTCHVCVDVPYTCRCIETYPCFTLSRRCLARGHSCRASGPWMETCWSSV